MITSSMNVTSLLFGMGVMPAHVVSDGRDRGALELGEERGLRVAQGLAQRAIDGLFAETARVLGLRADPDKGGGAERPIPLRQGHAIEWTGQRPAAAVTLF